jgi:tripartite-type tricarboxylate transporter receptor subunit TctC
LGPVAAQAQAWPGKTIRIVVPYTPGGSSDIIARAIAQPLQDALKQTVVVENKPGANGNTGTDFVAKSPPTATRCCCAMSARWRSPARCTRSCRSIRART